MTQAGVSARENAVCVRLMVRALKMGDALYICIFGRPPFLVEISQPCFSQPLDDLIDQVINLYIVADKLSPLGCEIRHELEQLAKCSTSLLLSSQLTESSSSHHRVPEQFRIIEF